LLSLPDHPFPKMVVGVNAHAYFQPRGMAGRKCS
jgi:hypothetical protein